MLVTDLYDKTQDALKALFYLLEEKPSGDTKEWLSAVSCELMAEYDLCRHNTQHFSCLVADAGYIARFLGFHCALEEYGIDAEVLREILDNNENSKS